VFQEKHFITSKNNQWWIVDILIEDKTTAYIRNKMYILTDIEELCI